MGAATAGTTTAGTTTAGTTGGTTAGANCQIDTWTNYAMGFFAANCVACHSYYATYAKVAADTKIMSRISSGAMPKNATLSAADKARILSWIQCKEPQ